MIIPIINFVVVLIGAFFVGVMTTIIAKSGKKKADEPVGSLVVDMTEPYDPGLYLSIESDDVIYNIVKNNRKTITLKVDIYGE